MSQAEEYEALVACVHEVLGEHIALLKGEGDVIARAVLAVIAEKAKEWPTESMYNARLNDWRTMFVASPIVKPEDDR